MKTTPTTYSLLVHSEEKGRSIFEGAVMGLIVLSTAFSGWQFASSSVVVPPLAAANSNSAAIVAKAAPVIADRG
ncbi:MAG: hypothetical protein H0W04_07445 [Chthoniobacterales bacterium]|nr:hypothetical protein [Chthoniobacterales bacterium]